MKIAFKKNGSSLSSKFMMWWTSSIYYHTELIFEDGSCFSADIESIFKMGTRFSTFNILEYDTNSWDVYNLPINIYEEESIKQWCIKENNCFYDVIGLLLTQFIPLSFQNKYWWFCSEVCMSALQENLGWFPNLKSFETDPGELQILIKAHLESL